MNRQSLYNPEHFRTGPDTKKAIRLLRMASMNGFRRSPAN